MSLDAISDQWEILLVALILGATHVIAPRIFGFRNAQTQAFGGGLSVAYVFLHLIPSLDASDDVVGPRVYFVALLGFVVFYGLDVLFQPPKDTHPTRYHAYLWAFFLYDGLLVFTLALALPPTPLLTLVFALSLALDVLDTDLDLQAQYGARFVKSGRWVLLARRGFRLCPEPRSASASPGDRYPHRCARRLHDVSHIQRAVPGSPKQKISRVLGRASHVLGVARVAGHRGLSRRSSHCFFGTCSSYRSPTPWRS